MVLKEYLFSKLSTTWTLMCRKDKSSLLRRPRALGTPWGNALHGQLRLPGWDAQRGSQGTGSNRVETQRAGRMSVGMPGVSRHFEEDTQCVQRYKKPGQSPHFSVLVTDSRLYSVIHLWLGCRIVGVRLGFPKELGHRRFLNAWVTEWRYLVDLTVELLMSSWVNPRLELQPGTGSKQADSLLGLEIGGLAAHCYTADGSSLMV